MGKRKPTNYWTKERCREECLKYKTKNELFHNNRTVLNLIYKNKWQDELFQHFSIVGEKYNNLTVLKDLGCILLETTTIPVRYVECKCDCGTISKYRYHNVKNGHTKSCGCFRRTIIQKYTKHKLYNTYYHIERQCYNEKCEQYPKIGGIGIKMCNRWKENSQNFFNDVGDRPSKKHRLVRIDNTKDFEPNNVKWDDKFSFYKRKKRIKQKKEKKPSRIVPYEKCKEEALRYDSRWELGKNNNSVYSKICRNKWYELFSHMKIRQGYSKEECHEVALKYKRRIDFQKYSKPYYSSAIYHGWLDDICSHMGKPLTLKERLIYVYEFDDNNCYVGLTCDEVGRHENHMRRGPVFKYMKKIGKTPERKLLTKYISVFEAKKMEDKIMKKYVDNGWNLLNTYKAGGTGGVYKYTKELCRKESLKYNDFRLFKKEKKGFVCAIFRNKWYDLISHMNNKAFKFRTKEDLHKIALNYSNRKEFIKKEQKHVMLARKEGWMDDICSHMVQKCKPNGWWNNYDNCKEESKKYGNRSEFSKKSPSAYHSSRKNKWLDIFYPKKYCKTTTPS
jgi:hypothetical protein